MHRQLLRLPDFAIAVLVAAIAVAMLVTAHSYSRSSGLFPIFIGWIFLALALAELGVQLRALLRHRAPSASDAERKSLPDGGVLQELGGVLWLGVMLALVNLVGFVVATPFFMFLFLKFAARRPHAECVIIALLATVFVYVVFAWLLEYRLYSGVILGG